MYPLGPFSYRALTEDGILLLRKRKDFPQDVVLLEFVSEAKVNEGWLPYSFAVLRCVRGLLFY